MSLLFKVYKLAVCSVYLSACLPIWVSTAMVSFLFKDCNPDLILSPSAVLSGQFMVTHLPTVFQ